jgi:phage/plasmid-like protein (TIGR03299 family)
MAHELSFQNGEAEAVYAGKREDVWHRLGRYFGERIISIADLRAVVGIPVEKLPVRYDRPIAGGSDSVETVSKKSFLTVRMDTGEELASVGPDYTVVQHDTALVQAVEPIVDAGFATVDAAGLLRGGAGGWTLLKWNLDAMDPIVRDVYRNEIQAFGLCLSWHDGTSANTYANVGVRAVCKNTIDLGMSSATLRTKVRHTKSAPIRQFEAAQETFGRVIAHHSEMATKYRQLQGLQLDLQMWKELVQKVAVPDPREAKDWDAKSPRADLVVERFRTKANRVYQLMVKGTGSDGEKTAWNAYNGLVESMDHDTELWKGRSDENRVLSLTDGPLAQIRTKVFDNLVAAAS